MLLPYTSKNDKGKKASAKWDFFTDSQVLKILRLVGVAYSNVEREWFPTEESYKAEVEVVKRAEQVMNAVKELGIQVKGYTADEYFLTNLIVDKPDIVINLVDTYKGKDSLQTSIPASLELLNIQYTGAEMNGLVLGNNRYLTKELLESNRIPTPPFQFIKRAGTNIKPEIGLPLIVKLNESGGSVGIDNNAVKESQAEAGKKVDEMLKTYGMPVVVERFIDGPEITAVVYDDGVKKHVFLGEKVFNGKPDGRHKFTSVESYSNPHSYSYKKHTKHAAKITRYVLQAFNVLRHRDYGKFDIRIDAKTQVPFITDSNPNTAFGPHLGLPLMEVCDLYGVTFKDLLTSLLTKHAKKIIKNGSDTTSS